MYEYVFCMWSIMNAGEHMIFNSIISGHTTVKMLQRLMANIEIFGLTRKCFQTREASNVHPATKHKEKDPFPNQLKAAHFVVQRKFVTPDLRSKYEKFGGPRKVIYQSPTSMCIMQVKER